MENSFYNFSAKTIDGREKSMADYRGKVLLVVNTASDCGFTPQYEGIQNLYEKHRESGLEVLGFPCNQFKQQEKGTDKEIKLFCDLNFKISFQLFSKIDVKGPGIHPIYKYMTESVPGIFNSLDIKWNFTKFLIDRDGNVIKRYSPITKPEKLEKDVVGLLNESKS